MSWGGLIAGTLGGAGRGVAQWGQGELDKRNRMEMMDYQAELEATKMRAAEELRRDGVLWGTTGEGGEATRQAARKSYEMETELGTQRLKDQAGTKRDIAVEDERAVGKVRAENEGLAVGARAKAEGEAKIALASDPKYKRALQTIAQASHVFGPSEQLAAAKLKEFGEASLLRRQLADAKDPEERERIQQRISDLSGSSMDRPQALKVIADLENAASRARATLSDPNATEEAKEDAQRSIGLIRATTKSVAARFGIKAAEGGDSADPLKAAMDAARQAKGDGQAAAGGAKSGGGGRTVEELSRLNGGATAINWRNVGDADLAAKAKAGVPEAIAEQERRARNKAIQESGRPGAAGDPRRGF
jgi:hypothetical protein